jgi:peptidoglycan/LPS O-acetylase OafA/YrhL
MARESLRAADVSSSARSAAHASSFEAFRARSRFPALDGLRAFSILAVLWHHTARGAGGFPLSDNGFLGVDMFFVLSGFLIVTLILRERRGRGEFSLRRFYARRTLRIFPIYYLVLLLILLFVTCVHPSSRMRAPFLAEFPYHVTYTTNWIRSSTFLAIAWSLATEEQFYVLWPPIEKWLPRASVALLVAIVLLNQLVNFGVLDAFLARKFGLEHAEYAILQITFTPICLGVLIAHVLDHPIGFERLRGVVSHRAAPWLVLATMLAAGNVRGDLSGWPRLVIQLSMTLFLAACVIDEDHPLARILALPIVRRIGAISYGMYLYHHLMRHGAEALLARLHMASPLWLFGITSLLTIAVAEASFRWIETPIANLKRRLS